MPDLDFQQYARDRDPEAFRRMVERHINAVHSAAERVLGQRGALADDVVQTVFALLARKAATLPEALLPGAWLHRQAVRRALNVLRTETRRERREHHFEETRVMHNDGNDKVWGEIQPHLDRALLCLPESERVALVLRYLEERSLTEVGACLGISPNAAQKRVSKALEALRRSLSRHRIVLQVTVLAALLAENSVRAAPVHAAARVTAHALAAAAAQTALPFTFVAIMSYWKSTAAAALLVLCAGAGWRGLGSTTQAARAAPRITPERRGSMAASALPVSAWLSAVGSAKAEDFPRLAAEALEERNLLRRHERLEAVFSRWAEVSPQEGWAWVQENCPEDLREGRLPRDPRLAFLLSWAAVDGPSAYDANQKMQKPSRFTRWHGELAEQWARQNPHALLEFIASGRWEEEKDEAMACALRQLAANDPETIYHEALKMHDNYTRSSVIQAVAEGMARKNAELALTWVLGVPQGSDAREQAYVSIFGVLGGEDPAGTARKMDEVLTGDLTKVKAKAARPVLESWRRTDPAAALRWASTLGSGATWNLDGLVSPGSPEAGELVKGMKSVEDRTQWEETLSRSWTAAAAGDWLKSRGAPWDELGLSSARTALRAWVREDAGGAAAWVDQLPGGAEREGLRKVLLSQMAKEGAPEAVVLAQLSQLRETPGDDAVRQLVAGLVGEHPAEVLAAIGALPQGEPRDSWLGQTAGAWAERDPTGAAAWAADIPSEETRAKITEGIMDRWWPDDPAAAESWAAKQSEGPVRDVAYSRVARSMTLEAPARAFAWAASISGEETRTHRLGRVLEEWTKSEPAAALAALEALPLAASEKTLLAAHLIPRTSR